MIAIAALLIYRSYFQKSSLNAAQDIEYVRNNSSNVPVTNNTTPTPNPTNNTTPSWP